MKTMFIYVTIMAASAFTIPDQLTGRWQTMPSSKGSVTSVVFRPDNSFEGFVNKKAFASGTYTLQHDIFSFTDNGCNGARGTYKAIFFSNSDSLRFEVITDSCAPRKDGMSKLIFGRVKY